MGWIRVDGARWDEFTGGEVLEHEEGDDQEGKAEDDEGGTLGQALADRRVVGARGDRVLRPTPDSTDWWDPPIAPVLPRNWTRPSTVCETWVNASSPSNKRQ